MFKKLKAALRRIDARQQIPRYKLVKTGDTHICPHCQTSYTGRFCPQCGLENGTSHFTTKTIMHKVVDVMGYDEYGNHSILRTMRDLIWRPGYMIREYLGGHSVAYFQPFKLLLLLVIIFTLLVKILGIEVGTDDLLNGVNEENDEVSDAIVAILRMPLVWLRENMQYRIMLQNIFIVTAMWKVYRRRVHYTWSETFIAQMYICCQFMLLSIAQILVFQRYTPGLLFPYLVNGWVVILFMLYDFFQFYGERRLWPALWRLVKVEMWLLLQYILLFILIIVVVCIYLLCINQEFSLLEVHVSQE